MKRLFDLVLVLVLLSLLVIPMLFVAIAVLLSSRGSVLYWSDRVGTGNVVFKMPKFRSMRVDTPDVATHKMKNPNEFLTPIGSFLRRNSLDELPQLFSIFKGDMSFVGPRPFQYAKQSNPAD
jgi:O-antigen biosynthesis protein WbqP